jgi:hypothetical protein
VVHPMIPSRSFVPRPARILPRFTVLDALFTFALSLLVSRLMRDSIAAWPLLAVSFAVALLQLTQGRWPRRQAGLLAVDAQGLTLDGVLLVERARIRQAAYHVTPSGAVVNVRRARAMALDVEVASERDAQEIVEALALDVHHTTASFWFVQGGERRRGLVLLASLLGFAPFAIAMAVHFGMRSVGGDGVMLGFLGGFVLWGLVNGLASLWATASLVVGADGVRIRRPLRRSTFYPYGELGDVRSADGDLVLTTVSGAVTRLGVAKSAIQRITDARTLCLAGASVSHAASVLARGDRDVRGWRQALGTLLGSSTAYRTPSVPPDTLWRVLEDSTQPPPLRAGAAVALRETLDERGRDRVRIAMSTCASGELRGALEATLEDDTDALERALESIDAEPVSRKRERVGG